MRKTMETITKLESGL